MSCIVTPFWGKLKHAPAWSFFIISGWNFAQFLYELLIFINPYYVNHKGDLFDYNKWVLCIVTALILAAYREIWLNKKRYQNG